ncbi:unnamed protein product, partial [Urochloa humidicola]
GLSFHPTPGHPTFLPAPDSSRSRPPVPSLLCSRIRAASPAPVEAPPAAARPRSSSPRWQPSVAPPLDSSRSRPPVPSLFSAPRSGRFLRRRTGAYEPRTSPSTFDLLPKLSADERARLPSQGRIPDRQEMTTDSWPTPLGPSTGYAPLLPLRFSSQLSSQDRIPDRQEMTTDPWPTPLGPSAGFGCMRSEASRMRTVSDALCHYNAEHQGAEFDAVRPLVEDSAYFRGKPWYHINFLACSRSSKNIKRFFAEVHYEPPIDGQSLQFIPVVETCTIIDESCSQYRSSCAFCRSRMEILHPVDDHDFVCGAGKDKVWMMEELFGMRFISHVDLASPNNEGEMPVV